MFVGEIGIPRREFLYDISYWEARRIYKGYRDRYRDTWSATRWQTFYIMGTWADLRKAGIHRPKDLLEFPWEKHIVNDADIPTDDEVEDMRRMLAEMNKEKGE